MPRNCLVCSNCLVKAASERSRGESKSSTACANLCRPGETMRSIAHFSSLGFVTHSFPKTAELSTLSTLTCCGYEKLASPCNFRKYPTLVKKTKLTKIAQHGWTHPAIPWRGFFLGFQSLRQTLTPVVTVSYALRAASFARAPIRGVRRIPVSYLELGCGRTRMAGFNALVK